MSQGEQWKLVIAASAERGLSRLPEKVASAVVEFMTTTLINSPKVVGHPLQRELAGLWSSRRGAYRIIYKLDLPKHAVEVVRVEHRADAYRPR